MGASKIKMDRIIKALHENDQGKSVSRISQELGIDTSTFYNWKKKYSNWKNKN
ncbi:hypothetical protein HMPREF9711_00717 [Myroides odoratimimus CCUG 3837]|uniref:transposase n=1 Tax=Myroides odoratimimus TaxID=76832 RepID=UPI000280A95C|nr:transposase [Myroides odoratimimus]EKB06345.1 hypothetical protein HMPREF9711_00717 [Myroides odoratimimus CCUG 3837]